MRVALIGDSIRLFSESFVRSFLPAKFEVSVIWATITPVNKTVPDSIEVPRWHPADLVAYNQMSVEIALSFGFQINDLHGRLSEAAVDDLLLPDGVHFNRAGNELIGKHVAAAIQAAAS